MSYLLDYKTWSPANVYVYARHALKLLALEFSKVRTANENLIVFWLSRKVLQIPVTAIKKIMDIYRGRYAPTKKCLKEAMAQFDLVEAGAVQTPSNARLWISCRSGMNWAVFCFY